MAKRTIKEGDAALIKRESIAMKQLVATEGWKILEKDIQDQMERISRLLTENRLRTKQETVKTAEGTTSFVTTAETQIAENAGMYKMARRILDSVQTIIEAPDKLNKLEREGTVVIQRREVKQDGNKQTETWK